MSLDPFDVVTVRKGGRSAPSVGRTRQEDDDPFAVVQVQRPKALTQGKVKDVSPLKVGAPSFKQFADAGAELSAAPGIPTGMKSPFVTQAKAPTSIEKVFARQLLDKGSDPFGAKRSTPEQQAQVDRAKAALYMANRLGEFGVQGVGGYADAMGSLAQGAGSLADVVLPGTPAEDAVRRARRFIQEDVVGEPETAFGTAGRIAGSLAGTYQAFTTPAQIAAGLSRTAEAGTLLQRALAAAANPIGKAGRTAAGRINRAGQLASGAAITAPINVAYGLSPENTAAGFRELGRQAEGKEGVLASGARALGAVAEPFAGSKAGRVGFELLSDFVPNALFTGIGGAVSKGSRALDYAEVRRLAQEGDIEGAKAAIKKLQAAEQMSGVDDFSKATVVPVLPTVPQKPTQGRIDRVEFSNRIVRALEAGDDAEVERLLKRQDEVLGNMSGMALGAGVGGTEGETVEERLRNAALVAGVVGGGKGGKLRQAATKASEGVGTLVNSLRKGAKQAEEFGLTANVELASMKDRRFAGVEDLGEDALELQLGAVNGTVEPLVKAAGLRMGTDVVAKPSFGLWFGENVNADVQPSVLLQFGKDVDRKKALAVVAAYSRIAKQKAMFFMEPDDNGTRLALSFVVRDADGTPIPSNLVLDLVREGRAGWNGAMLTDDASRTILALDEGIGLPQAQVEIDRINAVLQSAGFLTEVTGAARVNAAEVGERGYAALANSAGVERGAWARAVSDAERLYEGVAVTAEKQIAARRIFSRPDAQTLALNLDPAELAAVRTVGRGGKPGRIYTGPNHRGASYYAERAGYKGALEDGYTLTNGEFVSRSEAEAVMELMAERGDKLAERSVNAVQGREINGRTSVLRSEDIYKADKSNELNRRIGNIPSGVANPALVQGLGGFAAGATAGVATDDEGGMSPLQRALLYGAAGAAGGVGIGRAMRGKGRAVAPSIPELSAITETINTGKRAAAGESPSMLTLRQRLYGKLVSETYPLEEAARRFGTPEQGKELPGLVAQKQGSGRAAEGYLYDNLSPLLKTLSEGEKQSARALLKARRDLQIRQSGGAAKSTVPTDVLERGVLAGNADPKIAAVADRVTAMHRELLEMRYKAGLLSEEAYAAIIKSDDFYTPLYREFAEGAGTGMGGTMSGARSGKFNVFSSGVRRMDRTAEALEKTADPLEMVVADAARTYRDVAKQRVSNVIFSIADDNKMIGSNGLPLIERVQADPMSPPKGPDIVQQVRNGKLYTYRINDKDVLDALSAQDNVSSNALVKIASLLKNIKTAGIVVLPDFAAANIIRDVAMSGVQRTDVARAAREGAIGALSGGAVGAATADSDESAVKRFMIGAGLGAGAGLYARPFKETMVAVKQILGNDKIYREFLANGGSTEGFVVRNANDAAKILKDLEKGPGFSASDILIPTNWWQTLRKIGSVGEQATRVAAFKQGMESGMSGAQAALFAQDRTLRFANIGGSKTVKTLAATTPFWNAKVQGWDKLGRMLKDPKTYPLAIGMILAPTVALWTVNKDNPEYWERPIWERNLFWLIPKSAVGGGETGFYRIPKPFELGFLFASLPERALDYATQAGLDIPFIGEIQSASPQVAEPEKLLARSAGDIGSSTLEGTLPIPEVASLPTQLFMNKDLFRNRPIVSQPQLSPQLQVTEESSAVARALAKAGVSPEKTDFFIRNAFGTAGAEASKVLDIGARATGIPAPEASAGTSRIPFLGRFAERFTTSDKGQTDPETIARDRLRELKQIESDYNELVRRGDYGKLVDFAEKNMDDLELAKKIQPLETELDKLSRLRTQIRRDGSFSAEDRKIALEVLRERGQVFSEALIGVPKR
jgi:hypothetical protein